ncbi:hypothetical protein QGN29_01250 [Temperatibacter marinus]|uniref:Uncharacterized protein n=1 Tax=Temperatibacter marinus TaxID=1456591 RepID=A0AA52HAQ5_9PROT|nr:hypothetical protein [Temperatibacter marinus]WND02990.1 hypothetical protein QGN29_01250 [Temperatibacter marinus]
MALLNHLLPEIVDNTYRGHKAALWLYWPLTLILIWRSQHHMFADDGGAQSIATIPLDQWSEPASQTVIGIFAFWGLSQLLLALLQLLVVIRYKALVPLMCFILILEQAGRVLVASMKTIVTAGTAPATAGLLPLMVITVLMFILAMIPRGDKAS